MKTEKLEKLLPEVVEKLSKLNHGSELAAELNWCLGSFKHDNNPAGLIEKSNEALTVFKEARGTNSKSVSKKLVESLEKALN